MEPTDDILHFCDLLHTSKNLQLQVNKAKHPQEIIMIASSYDCDIDLEELRIWSKELKAQCFPWSGKEDQWRQNFFA